MDIKPSNYNVVELLSLINFDNKLLPSTEYVYSLRCTHFVNWLSSNEILLKRADEKVITKYLKYLENNAGLKAETINTALKALKRFYKALVHEGIVSRNPALGIDFIHKQRKEDISERINAEVLSVEEVKNINRQLMKDTSERGLQRYSIFYTLIKSGLRASELANLRFENIIFEDCGTNYSYSGVKEKKENPVFIEVDGKGRINRKVEFDRGILNHILEYHSRIDQHDFFFYTIPANGKQRRTPVDRYNLYHAVKRIGQIIGRKTWTHLLRHSYATISIQRGAKLQDVSSRLGHSSVGTAATFYGYQEGEVLKHLDII